MSAFSMTGFSKLLVEDDDYIVQLEMKSVNNRFRDIRFKMPSVLSSIEIQLRKQIEKNFKRGSFDLFISFRKNEKERSAEIDFEKVTSFIEQFEKISQKTGMALDIKPTDFMKNDFLKEDEAKESKLEQLVLGNFAELLDGLKKERLEEGESLVKVLKMHANEYQNFFEKIIPLKESYQENVRDKLKKRFEKENLEKLMDESRFAQEVIYYLEKLDIDEEVNRIEVHLKKLDSILSEKSEIGRKLEFLIQELNRETNTIGSKSQSTQISSYVVEMKMRLEKMREQALNME